MYSEIKLFSLICQVCGVVSVGNIITGNITINTLEVCIFDIMLSKTLYGTDAIVIKDDVLEDHMIKKLHESNNIRLYVKDYKVSMSIAPDTYIVNGDDRADFENIIDGLDRDWYRRPHALYIIALRNVSKDDLPAVFKVLLEHHFIHAIIIIEEDEDASVYSYLPYASGNCGRDPDSTITFGQCRNIKHLDVVDMLREYDKPDLKNCSFNVLAHHYPPLVFSDLKPANRFVVGIERFLVELLLEIEKISVNFTFVPETVEFGIISNNLTVTGIMENLYKNRVDLLFGGYSLNYRRAVLFDVIYIHLAFEDIFIPVTPSADLEDRWKIVYMMFEYKVWLLLLFTMVLCSIILSDNNYWSVSRYTSSSELIKLFGNVTQNIALKLRQKPFKNCIIIHWLWFTFLVSCYYQTRLTSYLTFRVYKPQINEYMSLVKYNLTPCLTRDMAMFLKSFEIAPIINEKYLDTHRCLTADLALDEIAKTSNKYTVTLYYRYLWWAAKHRKEKSQIHVMQENIYKTHYTIFLKRGFPLHGKFEATMLRLVECGFVHAIKLMHGIPNHSRYASGVAGAFEVRLLTLKDLIIPFIVLVVGHLFALVIFFIEICNKGDKTYVLRVL